MVFPGICMFIYLFIYLSVVNMKIKNNGSEYRYCSANAEDKKTHTMKHTIYNRRKLTTAFGNEDVLIIVYKMGRTCRISTPCPCVS